MTHRSYLYIHSIPVGGVYLSRPWQDILLVPNGDSPYLAELALSSQTQLGHCPPELYLSRAHLNFPRVLHHPLSLFGRPLLQQRLIFGKLTNNVERKLRDVLKQALELGLLDTFLCESHELSDQRLAKLRCRFRSSDVYIPRSLVQDFRPTAELRVRGEEVVEVRRYPSRHGEHQVFSRRDVEIDLVFHEIDSIRAIGDEGMRCVVVVRSTSVNIQAVDMCNKPSDCPRLIIVELEDGGSGFLGMMISSVGVRVRSHRHSPRNCRRSKSGSSPTHSRG